MEADDRLQDLERLPVKVLVVLAEVVVDMVEDVVLERQPLLWVIRAHDTGDLVSPQHLHGAPVCERAEDERVPLLY